MDIKTQIFENTNLKKAASPVKAYKKIRMGDWALTSGYLTQKQIDVVAAKMKITNQRFGQICLQEGFLDDEKLAEVLAMQSDYRYVRLKEIDDPELLKIVPFDLMSKYQLIPYEKSENILKIALSEPENHFHAVDELEMLIDMEIRIAIASEKKIRELLKKIEVSQNVLESVSDDMRLPLVKESDDGEDILSFEKVSAEESPIVRLVNSTILDAINKQASDIHIETSDIGVIIRYRIDGMLYQATEPIDISHINSIVSRIKVMSELDISEKRVPQDGRFKLKISDRYIDFRVSVLPTILGENVSIRILDSESLMPKAGEFHLEDMGLPGKELKKIQRMIRAPYGMFLMTGPTGSGKTTTLYRTLAEVNSKEVKIITIEDPVEYQLKGIMQIPVNEKKGLTFARGLRSILRHDPDKILVGEIRDSETAQIALQSALTGHLVFTTVHANSSFEVLNRFVHMGIDPYNLMSALNCIVAQRLIRTLCDCREKTNLSKEMIIESGLEYNQYRDHIFYEAKGCDACNGTGYKGRKAIVEIIELDDDIKTLFIEKPSFSVLKKKAAEKGTVYLRKAAIQEVLNGETTLMEANRVTFIESND